MKKIKKFIDEKKVFYDHFADKSSPNKWNGSYSLKKLDNKFLPEFLNNNEKYSEWFD